ncbi:hypothetical protein YQ44_22890 [Janthinobacterium sp. 1_2014MBL_MicDiv]|nr:hypothetical protein YQ44_22890 [Janthinobacterium sp. 1_2014MBL_MicDiv]
MYTAIATPRHTAPSLTVLCAVLFVAACAPMGARYTQDALPAAVQVPDGHQVAMQTVGVGKIAYECKAKKDMTGHEWTFVGPDAALNDRSGMKVGTYAGPPATWANLDGSKVTATQVAVAPAGAGNIPYQLVKANPATGSGAMQGVSYIQRVATSGGVAPSSPCGAETLGAKQWVPYQADYIFWKAA